MEAARFYTTIENQVRPDGGKGLLYDHYTNLNAALAKYYTICAAAAISELPYHAAFLMASDTPVMDQLVFDRRADDAGELYTTIENQVRPDGSRGLLYDHFDDLNAALTKYYTVCAAAAVSDIPYHAAYLLQGDGVVLEQRIFDRRTDATAAE